MQRNTYSDADADAVMHTMMLMLRGIHTIQWCWCWWWKRKNCSAHPFNLCDSLQQWELANPMHRDHSGEYCQYFILVLTLPSANTNCPWGICHSLGIDHRWENGHWPYTLIQPIKEYTVSRFPSGNLLVLWSLTQASANIQSQIMLLCTDTIWSLFNFPNFFRHYWGDNNCQSSK